MSCAGVVEPYIPDTAADYKHALLQAAQRILRYQLKLKCVHSDALAA